MKRSFLKLTILIVIIFSGACLPVARRWNALPDNAAAQIAKIVECKDDMLLIPLILPNEKRTILLGDPLPIRGLFDDLKNNSASCHEIGLVSITGGIGSSRRIPAFLLIAADGTIFDLDVNDMPKTSNSDIVFYRAACSPQWGNELANMLATGWPAAPNGFWALNSLKALGPDNFRWEHPETAIPVVDDFLRRHPIVTTVTVNGHWQRVWKPCFTPNVFCEKGVHKLPDFSADEVLLCRDKWKEGEGRELGLQSGESALSTNGIRALLEDKLKTGRYKVIAYQPRIGKDEQCRVDPERESLLHSFLMREIAEKYGVPLVIVSPVEPDNNAPVLPGIPAGLRQYWHCPECVRENTCNFKK